MIWILVLSPSFPRHAPFPSRLPMELSPQPWSHFTTSHPSVPSQNACFHSNDMMLFTLSFLFKAPIDLGVYREILHYVALCKLYYFTPQTTPIHTYRKSKTKRCLLCESATSWRDCLTRETVSGLIDKVRKPSLTFYCLFTPSYIRRKSICQNINQISINYLYIYPSSYFCLYLQLKYSTIHLKSKSALLSVSVN